MYCTYCGKEIPDDSQFCGYCGKTAIRPDAAPQYQKSVTPPHTGTAPPLPDSRPIRDVPLQTPMAFEPTEPPKYTSITTGKVIAATIMVVLVLAIAVFGALHFIGDKMTRETVRQVQNGYLGGYDDVTINELLTYLMEGFELHGTAGRRIVERIL